MRKKLLSTGVLLVFLGVSSSAVASYDSDSIDLRGPNGVTRPQIRTKPQGTSTTSSEKKVKPNDLSASASNSNANTAPATTPTAKGDTVAESEAAKNASENVAKPEQKPEAKEVYCHKPVYPEPVKVHQRTVKVVDLNAITGKHTVLEGEGLLDIVNIAKPDVHDDIDDGQIIAAVYRANRNAFGKSGVIQGRVIVIPSKERILLENPKVGADLFNFAHSDQLHKFNLPDLVLPWKEEDELIANDLERQKQYEAVVAQLSREYNECLALKNVIYKQEVADMYPVQKTEDKNKDKKEAEQQTPAVVISNVDNERIEQNSKDINDISKKVDALEKSISMQLQASSQNSKADKDAIAIALEEIAQKVDTLNTDVKNVKSDYSYKMPTGTNGNMISEIGSSDDNNMIYTILGIFGGLLFLSLVVALLLFKIKGSKIKRALMEEDDNTEIESSIMDNTFTIIPSPETIREEAMKMAEENSRIKTAEGHPDDVHGFEFPNLEGKDESIQEPGRESAQLIPKRKRAEIDDLSEESFQQMATTDEPPLQAPPEKPASLEPEISIDLSDGPSDEPASASQSSIADDWGAALSEQAAAKNAEPSWDEALNEQASAKGSEPSWDEALNEQAAAKESDPSWDEALNEQAAAKASEPSWDEALNEQASAKASEPSWDEALNEQAAAKESEPSWDEALNEQAAAKESEPSWDEALNEQAAAKESEPSWDEALNEQAAAKESEPSWDEALNEQASAKASEPSWDEALNEQAAAKESEPSWDEALNEQASAKNAEPDWADAFNEVEEAKNSATQASTDEISEKDIDLSWGEDLNEKANNKNEDDDISWDQALSEQAAGKNNDEPSWDEALKEQAASKEDEPSWDDALNEQAAAKNVDMDVVDELSGMISAAKNKK